MKISQILAENEMTVSCELFPPKMFSRLPEAKQVVAETAALSPSFISCTYGATGGISEFTVEMSKAIQSHGITALSHLTCVSSTHEKVNSVIDEIKAAGVENILALRGDIPKDNSIVLPHEYRYASQLVREIKERGDFCVGGACYPEGHPESESSDADLDALKIKTDAGAEFLTTQMFFDNTVFYEFASKARSKGINVPLVAGIMPVTNADRIGKMIELSKSRVPSELAAILAKYGSTPDMEKAGIEYAVSQINDLVSNGFAHIHIYTMNKPRIAEAIMKGIDRK